MAYCSVDRCNTPYHCCSQKDRCGWRRTSLRSGPEQNVLPGKNPLSHIKYQISEWSDTEGSIVPIHWSQSRSFLWVPFQMIRRQFHPFSERQNCRLNQSQVWGSLGARRHARSTSFRWYLFTVSSANERPGSKPVRQMASDPKINFVSHLACKLQNSGR